MGIDEEENWMTDDLVAATAAEPVGNGRFRMRVPAGWYQGRGAYGGLVFGAITRALMATEEDPGRFLRYLTAVLAAPVEKGEAMIETRTVRRGSGVTVFEATVIQNGQAAATATAIFGKTRSDDRRWTSLAAPETVSWKDVDIFPLGAPMAPEFTQYFEFRNMGPLPFSLAKDPSAAGFLRPHRIPSAIGAPEIVAYADAWWPSTLAIDAAPRPTATIAYTIQLFEPKSPIPPDLPLRYRAKAVAAQDGYVLEVRELWTLTGELVAINEQTFVIIR